MIWKKGDTIVLHAYARRLLTLLVVIITAQGCVSDWRVDRDLAPAADKNAPGRLGGTRWRLVEIQSMDDATGTTRPSDRNLYTMDLNIDGTTAMRLDCNRGQGSWSARPVASGGEGEFFIGPLAMTRALCPPPSLDQRIARDMNFVRSFLLKDGRLYLSLMADGGVYVWESRAKDE